MASLCKRQQCTVERRGFRQELDSWRHKLIHCVGKLSWHCVCACVCRGPDGAGGCWTCLFGKWSAQRAAAVMSTGKKPIGSHRAVIFFVTHGCCLAPPASHRTQPKKILSSNFLGWCRAGRQVLHLRALSVCPVGLLTFSLRRCVGCSGPLEVFYILFYGCLFIVSRSMSRVQMELRLGQSAAPL